MQTLSDQQGFSWKWCYRGVLDSEASSSLLGSGRLLRPRSIEMDGIIQGSPRQELSSQKASPLRRVALEVPTSAETVGKAQEAPSQVVQEEDALGTRLEGGQQEGETSTELWKMKAETSRLTEKMREVEEAKENHREDQEVWKELEEARQESEHSVKRLDPIKEGNLQLVEKKEEQGKLAKERSLVR